MEVQNIFIEAIHDYYYLLNKNYTEKTLLKIIGDRYSLSKKERTMLYRGIASSARAEIRKQKLCTNFEKIKNSHIYIDGFNVFFTVNSYLKGIETYIANDSLLRDAGEIHGSIVNNEQLKIAIDKSICSIKKLQPNKITILLDSPISYSGELASYINTVYSEESIVIETLVVKSPDYELCQVQDGFIATSDSIIIDKSLVFVFDIARYVLEDNYNLDIINLENYLIYSQPVQICPKV